MMNTLVFTEFKNFNVGRNGGSSKLGPKREIYREHRREFWPKWPKNQHFWPIFYFFTFDDFFLGKSMKLI